VAQELLITTVTEEIWKAMEETGVSKTELAKRMKSTKGYISQVLSGSRNMTLRTLSDICLALHKKAKVTVEARSDNGWKTVEDDCFRIDLKKVRYKQVGNVIEPGDDFWRTAA
jgi:transcriptional regulator with XRE-family HTH domain